MHELIVDNFAGGGGASAGIEAAIGRPVDIAINHSPAAMAMHEANHPKTRHYVEDVFKVSPREVVSGRPVGLAWFSPDCRHFSKAKGGKPVDRKIRGLAWVAVKWAEQVRPRVIILENVEEFETWGPLIPKLKDGVPQFDASGVQAMVPDPTRAGLSFRRWTGRLRNLGYTIEFRQLVAADYGAPTTRRRFFLIARCDGQPICWPEPTHRDPRQGDDLFASGLLPWRTSAECIDFSIPCPSIFERKRPLAEKTMARIAEGLRRYVIECADPFIVGIDNQSSGPGAAWPLDEPLRTITQENRFALVAPTLISIGYGEREGQAPRAPSLDKPLGTVVGSGKHALVSAFLVAYYGNERGGISLREPMRTITSKDRLGLVVVRGETYRIADIGLRMLAPRELANAQGFPPDYILTGPQYEQVARIGNSVCPPVATALVRANLPEMIVETAKEAVA